MFLIQNIEYTLLDKTRDSNGWCIVLRISIENSVYVIFNIYGHNKDKVEYFKKILSIVNSLDKKHIIIAGDYNMITDRNFDCINRQKNNDRLCNYFVHQCDQNHVVDSFRYNCPKDKKSTWFRHNLSLISSRWDISWISHSLLQCIGPTFFKPSYKSDHSLIGIDCDCCTFVSGKGSYKYNTSLLRNEEYVSETKQSVLDTIEQSVHQNFAHRQTWEFSEVMYKSH